MQGSDYRESFLSSCYDFPSVGKPGVGVPYEGAQWNGYSVDAGMSAYFIGQLQGLGIFWFQSMFSLQNQFSLNPHFRWSNFLLLGKSALQQRLNKGFRRIQRIRFLQIHDSICTALTLKHLVLCFFFPVVLRIYIIGRLFLLKFHLLLKILSVRSFSHTWVKLAFAVLFQWLIAQIFMWQISVYSWHSHILQGFQHHVYLEKAAIKPLHILHHGLAFGK